MAPTPYRAATSATKTGFEPDSSGEEDNITTSSVASTSTILGFADGKIANKIDEDDWRVSRIGGLPVSEMVYTWVETDEKKKPRLFLL